MKIIRSVVFTALSIFYANVGAATLLPIQLINPTGSSSNQTILSTGPSSLPVWGNPSGTSLSGITGLFLGNGASAAAYAGTSCTNKFPRSLDLNGVATCSSVANADLSNSSLTIGSTSIALGATVTTFAGVTLTAPVLGAATATTINGNTWTTGTGTLTIAASKTATVNNTLTLAGTDSTTMTFPSTSATIARTDAANIFTGHQTIEGVTSTGATGTGNLVFSSNPTFITPALGTPASGVATNLTGTAASLTAGNVTTNANLTGPITSSGNATSIASQTGTGSVIVTQASPTINTPTLTGITSGTTPSAGNVGEILSATGSSVSITNNTSTNITSLSLTAGEYILTGALIYTPAGTTSVTTMSQGISTTTATLPAAPLYCQYQGAATVGSNQSSCVPTQIVNISGTTTYYLVANTQFTVSTMTATGTIKAVRIH